MHTLSTHSNEAPVVTKSSRERRGSPKTSVWELSSHGACMRMQVCVRLRRDNYGAPRQLSVPDVVGEGEGGGGVEDEEEEEAESREGAQHQEQCSREHTECYVNTLV